MIWQDGLLVTLVKLVDHVPTPTPPAKRGPGRPRVYTDRLFLKALVVMIVRHLHTVTELLSGPIRNFFDASHGYAAATEEDASGPCSARRERSRSRSWRVNFQANGSANCS
jgi:hypothetical protein